MANCRMLKCIVFIGMCSLSSALYAVDAFPLDQVRLLDGPFKHAQDLNREHLLQYDVDRLLAPFLKEAGLKPKGEYYPNWSGLDGHIGGHYLTAMALYVAATGDEECKRRMDYMVDELAACQDANGNGYVGGVPNGKAIWAQVAAGNPRAPHRAWVPWYNIHKLYAGLRDAWIYGKNEKAKEVLIKYADWCDTLVADYTDEMMQTMLSQEHGGMNEVLADVYVITGDKKYLELAKRFSHKELMIPMAEGRDTLDNKHANTQVPKAVGFARIAELGGDKAFGDAASFFWETVTENRSTAFGGNSRREHFPSAAAAMEMIEEREGPESCNTYNMLKLTEELFRMDPQAKYADYYERALYNHILSTQNPEHGGYVYFTPLRPRHYRVYSAPNEGMWCCVGSGMENHGQYGRFIYSRQDDTLYLNLFIASELDWKEKGIKVRQETQFPDEPKTVITILTEKPVRFSLKVRHPKWVPEDQLTFKLGDRTWSGETIPSSYAVIDRVWNNGDRLEIMMPMHTTIESLPNVPEYVAIMYGPILLAAKTGTEDLQGLVADDGRWAHIAHGELLPLSTAPTLIGDASDIASDVEPLEGPQKLQFTVKDLIQPVTFKNLVLEPFFRVHDARYMMYWHMISEDQYKQIAESIRQAEEEKLKLDKQTIDRVVPGEQQPEADHKMKTEGSESGTNNGQFYRHAQAPGWFSYEMRVDSTEKLELLVRYWGNESQRRTFDILIDDQVLVTENTLRKWNKDEFVDVRYPVPAEMVEGKSMVTVKFKPQPNNYAGGIYDLRILKSPSEPSH